MDWGFKWYDAIPGVGAVDYGIRAGKAGAAAIEKPYANEKAGLSAMQDKMLQLKQERLDRMNALYGREEAQYAPTRAAMAAAYGDPSTWKI